MVLQLFLNCEKFENYEYMSVQIPSNNSFGRISISIVDIDKSKVNRVIKHRIFWYRIST